MPFQKLSITLEDRVANELRNIAGPRGVSAFVNEAVRQRLQARRVRALLDHLEETSGPVPDDIQREVDTLQWPE